MYVTPNLWNRRFREIRNVVVEYMKSVIIWIYNSRYRRNIWLRFHELVKLFFSSMHEFSNTLFDDIILYLQGMIGAFTPILSKFLVSQRAHSYQVISITNMFKSVDDDKRYDVIWIVSYNNNNNKNNMRLLIIHFLIFLFWFWFSKIIYIRPILHVRCLVN